jgi:hypothetical protein
MGLNAFTVLGNTAKMTAALRLLRLFKSLARL